MKRKSTPEFGSDSVAPPAVPTSVTARARLTWVLRLGTGLAIVAFLLSRGEGENLWRAQRTASPLILLGSVGFYLAGQALSAWKWQILLRARGVSISLGECCRLYLVGMFWNLWMPTNIGGDAVRALRAAPRTGGLAIAASSILVERLTGFAALLILSTAGIVAAVVGGSNNGSVANGRARIASATLLLLAFFLMLHFAVRRVPPNNKFAGKIASAKNALNFYLAPAQRGVLLSAMLISLVFQASQIALNIALARVSGLDVPPLVFCWLVPVLALASLLPLGIGGLGVREAAAAALLHGAGFNAATAIIVGWSLLWQATVWLSSLPGALWAFSSSPMSTPE